MAERYEVYIDGGCQPNPGGMAAYGLIVFINNGKGLNNETFREGKVIGKGPSMSNNVAEYAGLARFINWFGQNECKPVVINSDSQLLVNQMGKDWKIKNGLYAVSARQCLILLRLAGLEPPLIIFKWLERAHNLADEVATKALSEAGVVRQH